MNMNMRDHCYVQNSEKTSSQNWRKMENLSYVRWAHGESDYLEQISHSLCSLEFENHRPLYDWYLDQVYERRKSEINKEFARMNVTYMVTSKKKIKRLVAENVVTGWDDPRIPTISGMRRFRFYTPKTN